ncbi:MAG: GNAT family N-acetyltransferase [Solirubrobacteraceae bacterium]|nr:GNAT family N-acetyltransferase [Solirubrobacteraceae bacterium]
MDGLSLVTAHLLRPATGADEPFLQAVLAGTMEQELAFLPAAFASSIVASRRLQQAWRMRAKHYGHESLIVLDGQGERAGHLVVDQTDDAIHLLWLALLPEAQGRGLGSAVLLGVQDRAAAAGVPAIAHGEIDGAAAMLLVRHGFWVDPAADRRPVWRPALAAA